MCPEGRCFKRRDANTPECSVPAPSDVNKGIRLTSSCLGEKSTKPVKMVNIR